MPVAKLREFYARELEDWADTDTAVRKSARKVLSEFEVEGDSYGVPTIADIVDILVAKIENKS